MFSDGFVIIGTGDDDLRAGSIVLLRLHLRGRAPTTFELVRDQLWDNRTTTGELPFSIAPSAHISDIVRVDISFTPDRREHMHDDEWEFVSLTVTVRDLTEGNAVVFQTPADFRHKFDRPGSWRSRIFPRFDPSGSTIIDVSNDDGARVGAADVFVDSVHRGRTDRNGELVIRPAIHPDSRVVVRKRIHEQDYYRSHHDFDSTQNWNYRVYHTNVSIDQDGQADALPVTNDTSRRSITVSRDRTLIGVNFLTSLEWDASPDDFARYEVRLADFSKRLYDATDGQFFIEIVQIVHRGEFWDDCDCRVHASWHYGANAPKGQFLGHNIYGSQMKMSSDNRGNVYLHEFGHFGFDLGDEYKNGEEDVGCTSVAKDNVPMSRFSRRAERCSCVMFGSSFAPKLCSTHADNRHLTGTSQGDEACWDTIKRRYSDERWILIAPSDRGDIPGTIRWRGLPDALDDAFMQPTFHRTSRPNLPGFIGGRTIVVTEPDGAPINGVEVSVRDREGIWRIQGFTIDDGSRTSLGLHAGDRLRLDLGSVAFERDIPRNPPDPWVVPIET